MIGLSQLLLAGDCVDGVTPDCSDAAAHCGPDLDGSADQAETTPDGAQDTSRPDTFVPDAAPDADLDAGDEE